MISDRMYPRVRTPDIGWLARFLYRRKMEAKLAGRVVKRTVYFRHVRTVLWKRALLKMVLRRCRSQLVQ